MQIPKEFLEAKNYEGTRLIEIKDAKVKELKGQLKELQLEANPTLAKMEDLAKILDPLYTVIREHTGEIEKAKKEMEPTRALYDVELKKVEEIDQRAQLVKNKLQPMINEMVKGDLGEFEKATQVIEKDEKIYVEVVDEIEEKVKQVRALKK